MRVVKALVAAAVLVGTLAVRTMPVHAQYYQSCDSVLQQMQQYGGYLQGYWYVAQGPEFGTAIFGFSIYFPDYGWWYDTCLGIDI